MSSEDVYENWMTNLPPALRQIPLTEIAIPGSHNSFSYGLDTSLPFAPDLDSSISTAANALATVLPVVRNTVHNWSKNQKLGLTDQLKAGIRYFDCRVGVQADEGRVRFLHGLWGPSVFEELSELVQFLELHPGEVVLLDFNHFYEFTDEDHVAFTAELISLLGDYLIPYNEHSTDGVVQWQNLHLDRLADLPVRRQVIVFYANDTGVALSDLVFWPHSTIEAPWPRVTESTALIRFHDEKFEGKKQHVPNGCPKKFYVCQGVLTPDGGLIMRNLTKNYYDNFASQTTSAFVNWLSSKCACNADKNFCNIFIVDGVELASFVSTVLALNR